MGYRLAATCRGCGAPPSGFRSLLEMAPMPLAGEFPETRAEAIAAERYPLTWVQCDRCTLVQVLEDVDDALLYGNYHYGSSTIPGLVRHFEAYASSLIERFGRSGITILEIGCNDGVLLSRLPTSWRRIGVDPSDVAVRARTGDYELIREPFSLDLALRSGLAGSTDLVTTSNALAHFTDLLGAIQGARLVLRPGGRFIVEVHDLAATLAGGQWDTIYHEHKAEWSVDSLRRCVEPIGFELAAADRLPLHGGLLRVEFARTERPGDFPDIPDDPGAFVGIRDAYTRRRETPVYRELESAAATGRRIAAYGASGRANVWMNQLPELQFEAAIDGSPLRVDRWIPGVATPIVAPSAFDADPPDVCLVTAWNYASDIRAQHPGFSGRWLQTFGEHR